MKFIYLIKSLEDGYYKIGVSKHPQKRVQELNTGNSSELRLIHSYKSEHANIVEKALHRRFEYLRKEGEWFDLSLKEEISFLNECENIEKNLIFLKKNNNVFL